MMRISTYFAIRNRGRIVASELVPEEFTTVSQVNRLAGYIRSAERELGTPVAVAAWVQPGGGPVLDYRLHTLSDIKSVHEAYQKGQHRTVYPQLGIFYDGAWCKEQIAQLARRRDGNAAERRAVSRYLAQLPGLFSTA